MIKKRSDAAHVLVVSDTHINSTVALASPTAYLDDGGKHEFSDDQRELWRAWQDVIERASRAKRRDRSFYLILNGDLVEDNYHPTTQTISRNQADILNHAAAVLEPLYKIADRVFVIRGTEAHVGLSGVYDELVAKDIDNAVPSSKAKSWWHLRASFGGALFDIAHHTSAGQLPWTEKNAANKLASVTRMRYGEMHEEEPQVVLRSHVHKFSDSGQNFLPLRAVVTPCWSLFTSHSIRIGAENNPPDIGAVFFEIEGGIVQEPTFWKYALKREKVWTE